MKPRTNVKENLESIKKMGVLIGKGCGIFIIAILAISFMDTGESGSSTTQANISDVFPTTTPESVISADNSECNVLYVPLHGQLVTYDYYNPENYDTTSSEVILSVINEVKNNDRLLGVLLEVDSRGGSPVGAEEISLALKGLLKPSVALIREGGVSAAYWSATGAQRIFASENSAIGGIGVYLSYLDNAQKNAKEGLTYNTVSIGKFKNMGDPDKPMTKEEREFMEKDGNLLYENFIKAVSANRNLQEQSVRSIAEGQYFRGKEALRLGLIDEIGNYQETENWLSDKIGQKVIICQLDDE